MEKKLTHSKWFLYLTEFFAGMSVMAVELGASRLMAPYFSSSQIVWTVIIGVIMVAMAVGNIWGGRMADKSKSPDRLYGRVIIAAIWIALIPFAGRWMIAGISFLLATFVTKHFLVWAALAACLVIFAFPCVLLGTVTPSLTKFTVDNLDDTGKTVGQLNALNTIGSIIGTFVPTFLTIPAVGTAATFLIFAGVLAAIGIVYFIFERKRTVTGIIAVVLVAGLCFALPTYSFAFWESDLALEDESIYNYLQVKDDDHTTTLSTNVLFGVQSVQNKDGKLTGMYYDYALAAPCMAGMDGTDNTGRSAMILGMGSGTYAGYCVRYFPGMTVQGADASPLQFQQSGLLIRVMVAGQQHGLHSGIPAHLQETGAFFQPFRLAGAFTGFTEVPAHHQMSAPLQQESQLLRLPGQRLGMAEVDV